MTPEILEARLIAQRKLLARIVAALGDRGVDSYLADRNHLELGAEDPGAVPDAGLAFAGAVAEELREIEKLAEALRGQPPAP
ncbi:MAG: hypothetical protein RI538_04430 [Salibaculum sp.]|uniref:hypothetical protein n=1 Tax=Roseovarius halophilus (ex Wu et al. 2025) TaxID=3376060 RepID=UPI00286FE402|nr:hypothetical protein [Salibaculum sp.]MDR9427788.1 hypothetical protein [Salibaculum sp.]MDR9482015.1 hypothetical protein [Salibaculum sp.]